MNKAAYTKYVILLSIAGLIGVLLFVWLFNLSYFIAAPVWIAWVVFLIWLFRD